MDAELRQRLIDAERGLLSALWDENLLSPFHSTWSKLQADISSMKARGELSKDTLALADVMASRIATIAQCYLEVQQEQKLLTAEWAGVVEDILNGPNNVSVTSASPQSSEQRPIAFIETVHNWLLENIHNPYPSTQFKACVANTHRCSQNSVNTWFINARRRIGWTSLCREQFHNCRTDALDAAYRALIRPDPARPLPTATIQAFAAIKANAEGLYSSMVGRSTHAKDLDAPADVTEYGGQTLAEDNARQGICGKEAEAHTHRENWRSETTYPSPFSSPPPPASAIPTLVPSLSDESDDEDQDVAPPALAGRKRRMSLSGNQCATHTERPKRLCVCPFPTPSIDASEPPSPSLEAQASCVLPRSRKRRLSEGVRRNIPNRPHGLPVTPRAQVVSDPLPRTISNESDIENWFQTNFRTLFDLPAPVECPDLDPSAQWEVLFGGYSIPSALVPSEPHLMHSPLTSSEAVLQDVQERSGDFSGFDNLFLPSGNEACEDTLPNIRSSDLQLFPEHQFALSAGSVSPLDDWVTLCESTSQAESVGTHASSELGFFEFPDLSVPHPLVDSQGAFVLGDIGLPVGA
ncbi:hypothetical protein M404DRAFT_997538 [Pisolithus tinctorius Marx 270]|uniref:Homeobox domain-containing protein n=1 Tax=Pisolithus tinctorius Marx 270 TaxID=870435 RepID=A0A0C3P5V3_PISTI|nr:hypothetical protein M404DRAFT_997538 [Pisolithus tinctorius Marx 270]